MQPLADTNFRSPSITPQAESFDSSLLETGALGAKTARRGATRGSHSRHRRDASSGPGPKYAHHSVCISNQSVRTCPESPVGPRIICRIFQQYRVDAAPDRKLLHSRPPPIAIDLMIRWASRSKMSSRALCEQAMKSRLSIVSTAMAEGALHPGSCHSWTTDLVSVSTAATVLVSSRF